MEFSGNIDKMETDARETVQYTLPLSDHRIPLNALIGTPVTLQYLQQIHCVNCGKLIKKAYGQGFCFTCFSEAPDNSECIVRPELCQGHLGKGRDPQWEMDHHVKEHFVYLAQSGGVKVGVTRTTQIPTRWIDQGASRAIILARVPYRKLAGVIEVELKKHISDKTNWQQMLNQDPEPADLVQLKQQMGALLPADLQRYITPDSEVTVLQYPVTQYPLSPQTVSLDKKPEISGVLAGIKGQYLIFEDGSVINIRSHSGYKIKFTHN